VVAAVLLVTLVLQAVAAQADLELQHLSLFQDHLLSQLVAVELLE
jgi:hypothetical protein